MFEPVSVSLSPNVFKEDVFGALEILLSPGKWVVGSETRLLEKDFGKIFPGFEVVSFASGRTALLAILKSLGVGRGDEILLQSFTCVVVANAVIRLGAKPVYVDIENDSFNMDPIDLARKITSQTRAVIVQHTFGYPAKIKKIAAIAKKHRLEIIEDCAHGIDIKHQGKKLGMLGEAAFFSFGRDKPISSVFGGMAITGDKKLAKKLRNFQSQLPYPSRFWVVKQLLHPLIFSLVLPLYNFFSLGKLILVFSQKLKLLSWPVVKKEKEGHFPAVLLVRLPNALAHLVRFQLKRLKKFNQNRVRMVKFYVAQLRGLPVDWPKYKIGQSIIPLLRLTIKTDKAQLLYEFAKKKGVILNDWYCPAISPRGVDYQAVGYDPSLCPVAEKIAPKVVNLPTHPKMTLKEAEKVVEVIREFFRHENRND